MKSLESAERLVRFFDKNWNPVGHTFADVEGDGHELSFNVSSDVHDLVKGYFLNGLNVSLSRTPKCWRVKAFDFNNSGMRVRVSEYSRWLEAAIMPPAMFLAPSKRLGAEYFV